GLVPVPAGAVAVLAGVVPAPDVAVPGLADVTVVDELELLELLELLLTAALVSAPLTGTVKLGAPEVFVVPVPPPPQPDTARARTTAMVPTVAGRCKR
nr:hypothetical protein [Actinomycetota bacterium]